MEEGAAAEHRRAFARRLPLPVRRSEWIRRARTCVERCLGLRQSAALDARVERMGHEAPSGARDRRAPDG
jgi:hypothetical protein